MHAAVACRMPGQDQVRRINMRAVRDRDVINLKVKRLAKSKGSGRYQTLTSIAMLRVCFGLRIFEPPSTRQPHTVTRGMQHVRPASLAHSVACQLIAGGFPTCALVMPLEQITNTATYVQEAADGIIEFETRSSRDAGIFFFPHIR